MMYWFYLICLLYCGFCLYLCLYPTRGCRIIQRHWRWVVLLKILSLNILFYMPVLWNICYWRMKMGMREREGKFCGWKEERGFDRWFQWALNLTRCRSQRTIITPLPPTPSGTNISIAMVNIEWHMYIYVYLWKYWDSRDNGFSHIWTIHQYHMNTLE